MMHTTKATLNSVVRFTALETIKQINVTITNMNRNSKTWEKLISDYNSGFEYGYNEYLPPVFVDTTLINRIDSIIPVFASPFDRVENTTLKIEYPLMFARLMDERYNPTPKYSKYGFASYRFNSDELKQHAINDNTILTNDELTLYYMLETLEADTVLKNQKAIAEKIDRISAWTPAEKKYIYSLPTIKDCNYDISVYIGACNKAYSQYAVKNQVKYIGRKVGNGEMIPKVYIDIVNNWNDQLFDDIKGYIALYMIEAYKDGHIVNRHFLNADKNHDCTLNMSNYELTLYYEYANEYDLTEEQINGYYPVFDLGLDKKAFNALKRAVSKAIFDKKGTRSKKILVSYETSVLENGLEKADDKDNFKANESYFYDSLKDINTVLECLLSAEKYALYTSLIAFMLKTGKGLKDFSRYYALTEADETKIYKSLDNLICKIRDVYKIALAYKNGDMKLFRELVPNTKSQKRITEKLDSINIKKLDIKVSEMVYHASAC